MRDTTRIFLGVLGAAVILLGGCAERRRPAIPWSTAVLVRPSVPQHEAETGGDAEPAPDLKLAVPNILVPLATRSGPARPRSATPSTNQNAPAGKAEMPQIVPELSTQESASLQRQAEESLGAAERNLATAAGKPMNPTETDLASKVRGFISDAREAGRAGDWTRARDLAKKAEILSEELIGSL
jgi:hypothetical protein